MPVNHSFLFSFFFHFLLHAGFAGGNGMTFVTFRCRNYYYYLLLFIKIIYYYYCYDYLLLLFKLYMIIFVLVWAVYSSTRMLPDFVAGS